ncbi:hypothetical protein ACFE04_010567 [Oxalis oulophora]
MAHSICFTPSVCCSLNSSNNKPGILFDNSVAGKVIRVNQVFQSSKNANLRSMQVKSTDGDDKPTTKARSIVCQDCDGNGAISCTQCEGNGVNLVDHFNGRFKAGGLCWLCRGKRDILCGNCNGAGFIGGFMNTTDS